MNRNSPYETGLDRNPANYVALSPLSFLARAAEVEWDVGERQTALQYYFMLSFCYVSLTLFNSYLNSCYGTFFTNFLVLSLAFDFDIDRILADARERQRTSGRRIVSPPVREEA